MGSIAYLGHNIFRAHQNPQLHPENPGRLVAIEAAIAKSDLPKRLVTLAPRVVTMGELCAVHSASYIELMDKAAVSAAKEERLIQLDADTFMSAGTFDAAKLAAGAGLIAVEAVKSGNFATSFIAARPPGHHALSGRQMGFCIFNNIAIAARYARHRLGYKRVLIIDWDVHHGNGTQEIFYDDPSVCFISLHQDPIWPFSSGAIAEDGVRDGKGYNINIPLPAGTGDRGYLAAWDQIVAPIALEYQPEIILLSAGYDAHQLDPMGGQQITTTGFAMLSQRLADLSKTTGAKVVCFLEGGYNKLSLSESVVVTLQMLSDQSSYNSNSSKIGSHIPEADAGFKSTTSDFNPQLADAQIESVRKHFCQYWRSLALDSIRDYQ